MKIDIYVHFEHSEIGDIKQILNQLRQEIHVMSVAMDQLVLKVQENSDAVDSAIQVIQSLRQQIIDAGVDQTKLNALIQSLDTDKQQIAEAIAANTPAA